MDCLDKYRSKLVGEINKDLRKVLAQPEEELVHDFRVGIKRLTALYYFPGRIDTNLKAKRIPLKRYHHKTDAFRYCPGHKSDETEVTQIKILEQLLGDWHDRVITIEILQSLGASN